MIIGSYRRETRFQDAFSKLRRALIACDLENDPMLDASGDGDERLGWSQHRHRSSTATSSHRETPPQRKRKRRRTGTNKNGAHLSRNGTHDQTATTSTMPKPQRRKSHGAQLANQVDLKRYLRTMLTRAIRMLTATGSKKLQATQLTSKAINTGAGQ